MQIEEKVISILEELSGKTEIGEQERLQEELGLDSLAMVGLLVEIEETFEITLDESDMNPYDLNTVKDVIELVQKYRGDSDE